MGEKHKGGEGNREADRRYREGVRKTVEDTSGSERNRKAREVPQDELEDARSAEEKGKARARK